MFLRMVDKYEPRSQIQVTDEILNTEILSIKIRYMTMTYYQNVFHLMFRFVFSFSYLWSNSVKSFVKVWMHIVVFKQGMFCVLTTEKLSV